MVYNNFEYTLEHTLGGVTRAVFIKKNLFQFRLLSKKYRTSEETLFKKTFKFMNTMYQTIMKNCRPFKVFKYF
jgi:hypothetical protein